jgi:hypothetical protein
MKQNYIILFFSLRVIEVIIGSATVKEGAILSNINSCICV